MKFIIKILSLFLLIRYSYAKEVNIYLLFESPKLYKSVHAFNTYLERNKILARYQIEPSLAHHPLHITLFLASYPDDHIKELRHRVAQIAKHWHSISIKTARLVTAGGYVMLEINNASQANVQNHELQKLSDQMTLELNELRDFNAQLPDWASSILEKRKAFLRYGSPNVFFEYSPHFTLITKKLSDPIQAKQFQKEMSLLIQSYNFPIIETQSSVIAIGYSDSFGQITREIEQIKLT